jgi:tRNA(fMet)-specific endonuclease VapC
MKTPLLDTDTISFYLKGNKTVAEKTIESYRQHQCIYLSVVTYYEIMNGLLFKDAHKQLAIFNNLIESCQVMPINTDIANIAAEIYADLRRRNQVIGHTDVLIGATAIHHDMVIITNNQADFSRIPNLDLDNWM